MAENYEEIVRNWYVKMRSTFTDVVMQKYRNTDVTLEDVENIYQDVFIAIYKNLQEGRIQEDTSWGAYIVKVGLNMASKRWRSASRFISVDESDAEDPDTPTARAHSIRNTILSQPSDAEDTDLARDPEAQALLGEELNHLPEPCASIIRMSYYDGLSDAEIATVLPQYRDNGKPVAVNAKAIKARRWLCMRDLVYRVKTSLYHAGIIDEKPEKPTRNGK